MTWTRQVRRRLERQAIAVFLPDIGRPPLGLFVFVVVAGEAPISGGRRFTQQRAGSVDLPVGARVRTLMARRTAHSGGRRLGGARGTGGACFRGQNSSMFVAITWTAGHVARASTGSRRVPLGLVLRRRGPVLSAPGACESSVQRGNLSQQDPRLMIPTLLPRHSVRFL